MIILEKPIEKERKNDGNKKMIEDMRSPRKYERIGEWRQMKQEETYFTKIRRKSCYAWRVG